MSKISIIIPVYNSERYLQKCLDSVINQTFSDIEIICIDDGSSDNSVNILNEYAYKDSRIKVLNQEHKKQGAARNWGMRIAQGDYIGFVDSDDWIEPDMYEKLYIKATETDADVVMCNFKSYFSDYTYKCDNKFSPQLNFDFVYKDDEILNIIFLVNVVPWNKLIKKDVILKNNVFFPEDVYFEDYVFHLELLLNAKSCTFIENTLYNYLQATVNSTCFSRDKNQLEVFKMLDVAKKVLKKYSKNRKEVQFITLDIEKILGHRYRSIKSNRYKILYAIFHFFLYPKYCFPKIRQLFFEYRLLKKINKEKNILLWGASLFLEDFINKYKIENKNIIGIIDGNPKRLHTKIRNYTIYSPEEIKDLKPKLIISTIKNNNVGAYREIKYYIKENNLNIELAKNIFE